MAQKRHQSEAMTMAVPLSSARQAALNKFVETFAAPILDVLAVPHFPGLFSLVDTRPLVFHIHFDFHPEKKPRSQLSLLFARQTTRAELQAFHLGTGGLDAARFAGVEWDSFLEQNKKTPLELGPEGRKDALIAIRFTAAGPGDGLNYVKKIYQRYSWSRSGIHPVNLDLDFETPLKILLHMLEAKTPLGYWTNAVLFAQNPEWLRRADAAFSSAKSMAREVMEGVADDFRKKGTQVHPAALYYSMSEQGGELEEMGL